MSRDAQPSDQRIEDLCQEKARKGDGAFAIAYALLRLAGEQAATARALHLLGTGNAATDVGAIEALGMMVKEAAQTTGSALQEIAEACAGIGVEPRSDQS